MATTSDPPWPSIVREIEALGFGWRLEPDFDLSRTSPERRIQIRDTDNYEPREMVKRFATQMSESAFAPIGVTADELPWTWDGATRIKARHVRGDRFCAAFVLDVEWEGKKTTEADRLRLRLLGATLNNNGGAQLSQPEARDAVRSALKLGVKNEEIARRLGIVENTVSAVRKEVAAEDRLHHVGLSTEAGLKGASLRAFGQGAALALNDVPFKTLVELAADAGFNSGEIIAAAKEAKATGSDADALEYLKTLRSENDTRIVEYALTGKGRPPMSGRLRPHLSFAVGFEGREAELVEHSREEGVRDRHAELLSKAIAVLSQVQKLQEAP